MLNKPSWQDHLEIPRAGEIQVIHVSCRPQCLFNNRQPVAARLEARANLSPMLQWWPVLLTHLPGLPLLNPSRNRFRYRFPTHIPGLPLLATGLGTDSDSFESLLFSIVFGLSQLVAYCLALRFQGRPWDVRRRSHPRNLVDLERAQHVGIRWNSLVGPLVVCNHVWWVGNLKIKGSLVRWVLPQHQFQRDFNLL